MDIPTINELRTQIENDLRTELGITQNWFGKVFLRSLATVQAGKLKIYYLAAAKVQKNIFADTAESENNGGTLERFGRVKIQRNPNPAIAGVYILNVTGQNGAVIPKGTLYKSTINSTNEGYLFEVTAQIFIVGTTGQVNVRALTPGTESQLDIDDELELTSPLANIDSLAYVDSVDTTPVSAEDIEDYREIVLDSFRIEVQGGAAQDYVIWSLDVAGVRTSYPYTKDGQIYAVQVFVEALPDDSQPGQPEGVPPTSMLDDVRDAIEIDPDTGKGRRPVGVFTLEVLAVVPVGVTITIEGLTDDSASVVNAIENSIIDLLYTVRPYIAGADGENRNDILYISQIITAVSSAIESDIFFSNLIMEIGGTPVTFYAFGTTPATYGNYPYLESLIINP